MYKISVTVLESFRRYMTEASPFDTEEKLLQSIKGIFRGNAKTEFGQAYHAILEGRYTIGNDGKICAKGMRFTPEQAKPALGYRTRHPQIVSEVPVSKIYSTKYFPVMISGRVDAIEGLFIRDAKTKFRSPDFVEYMQSCQWKFYTDMLEATGFLYDVFEIICFGDEDNEPYGNLTAQSCFFPDVQVCEVKSVACHPYAGMHDELTALVDDFIGYVENRNLWPYLKTVNVAA